MPLRDRATPKPRTTQTLASLEQEIASLRAQISEQFELLQVSQQQADIKTARQAPEYDREFEMLTLPFRHWDPGAVIQAKSFADEGDLERAADLWESALSCDRTASAMEQRINGLEGLPVRFTGDGEDVLSAISSDFWSMMRPGDRAAMRRWGLGLGICPVYVIEWLETVDGRQVPICEVWNPRFLRWRQGETLGKREWWIQTATGQIRLADQPGRWFLFTPFSGPNQRPWVDGLWYSTATWWLAKSFGIPDLASFSQSHATPKWFLTPKEGAQIAPADKAEAIRRLATLPQRSGMYVPSGFLIEQKEASSNAWNAIVGLIELANKALTIRIIGTDSTTDKESSYASTAGGMQLLYGKFRTDADAESAFWHDGPLQFWYLLNFRGTRKLQDRRVLDLQEDPVTGSYRLLDESERRLPRKSEYGQRLRQLSEQIRAGDSVPWPTRDATPPQDMAAVADTQGKAAGALVQLSAAATATPLMGAAIAQIDVHRYLERYFPMLANDESGVQLQMEDGTILELSKGKTGSGWITVNGTHVYAEPGKAIDFKNLKATAGGQASVKKTPQEAAKEEMDAMPPIPKMKGVKKAIKLATRDGSDLEVEATVYGGTIAVHEKKESFAYKITHVNTGMSFTRGNTKEEAHRIAKRIVAETPESFRTRTTVPKLGEVKWQDNPMKLVDEIREQETRRTELLKVATEKSLEQSTDFGMYLEEDAPTDFPTQGDNKAVSLRDSGYAVFDPAYAADIKANWPEIWNAGGNDVEGTEHSGNDQYRRLLPVVERGGEPETDTEEQAIRRRQAWAARHFANNRLAGIVALMKWFVVGEIGERGMKAVIEERKDALKKRENEHKGPTLLLSSAPRNVRQHLHEGLEFADDTVEAMAQASPDVMDDITGQVLRVLADAKDYTDARKRLQDAFPKMDRSQLRNMLTGGMLIAQAAGMETVKRETVKDGKVFVGAGTHVESVEGFEQ